MHRTNFKVKIFRSDAYLDYIREQVCCVCQVRVPIAMSEAHHVPLGKAGKGIKAPDSHCVPLCREHHQKAHQYTGENIWEGGNLDVEGLIIGYLTEYLRRKEA